MQSDNLKARVNRSVEDRGGNTPQSIALRAFLLPSQTDDPPCQKQSQKAIPLKEDDKLVAAGGC